MSAGDQRRACYLEVRAGVKPLGIPLEQIRRIVAPDRAISAGDNGYSLTALLELESSTIAVLDLDTLLAGQARVREPADLPHGACIMIVETFGHRIGFLVDALGGVRHHDRDSVQTLDPLAEGAQGGDEQRGFLDLGEATLQIVDLQNMLSASEVKSIATYCTTIERIRAIQDTAGGRDKEDSVAEIELSPLARELAGSYVLVAVRGMVCALPTAEVREIRAPSGRIRLPRTRRDFAGVLPLRGRALPVLDLGEHFALREIELADDRRAVILVSDGEGETGLLADEILGLDRIAPEAICAADDANGEIHAKLCRGFADTRVGRATLLNLEALLVDDEEPLLVTSHRLLGDRGVLDAQPAS